MTQSAVFRDLRIGCDPAGVLQTAPTIHVEVMTRSQKFDWWLPLDGCQTMPTLPCAVAPLRAFRWHAVRAPRIEPEKTPVLSGQVGGGNKVFDLCVRPS